MSLPCLLDTAAPPHARMGHETVHGGPVEHLVGTRARTVLRVRRNALGVLPILTNTSAYSLCQCELGQDVDNYFAASPEAAAETLLTRKG
jgi:hypothetical protein